MFTVNKSQCIGCKACIEECPAYLLSLGNDNKAFFIDGASKFCIKCGHCEAVCPTSAVMANFEPTELVPFKNLADFPSIEEVSSIVLQRRSIRSFRKKTVDTGLIERLLDTTRYAPTAKNSESLKWIFINSRENVYELAKQTIDTFSGHKQMTPVVRLFQTGIDVITRNAPHMLVAVADSTTSSPEVDVSIALTTFEFLAATADLGTCWAGYFRSAAMVNPAIGNYLGVEEPFKIYGALMVGYPKHKFFRVPLRKELMLTIK